MKFPRVTLPALAVLAFSSLHLPALAQASQPQPTDCGKLSTDSKVSDCAAEHMQIKTIYFTNITSESEANTIVVAIRNVFGPSLILVGLPGRNAIVVSSYPQQISRIEALVKTLDQPHKTYRLTYTITELDAGKTLGTQHLSMVVVDGQSTTAKEGDKIPIATGSSAATEGSPSQTQFQYLDVGMNINATLNADDTGAILKTKVEQSGIGQTSTIAGVTEPIIRQTVLEATTLLTLGKPVMLGSLDVPNSTRHLDIAVVADPVR